MNLPAVTPATSLVSLLNEARSTLSHAETYAQVLDARTKAAIVYDAAKRLAKVRHAHGEVVADVMRMQGDALAIEAAADIVLRNEVDAARERGEVQKVGGNRKGIIIPEQNNDPPVLTLDELRISAKDLHHGKKLRDAEKASPGIIERSIDKILEDGGEPTRAAFQRSIAEAVNEASKPKPRKKQQSPPKREQDAGDGVIAIKGACRIIVEQCSSYPLSDMARWIAEQTPVLYDDGLEAFDESASLLWALLKELRKWTPKKVPQRKQ